MRALSRYEDEIVSLLLSDPRIDIHLQDEQGNTALIETAGSGNVAFLEQLFSKDNTIDVNQRDSCGNTALLMAARRGWGSAVQFLLDMGADVNVQDSFGHTPLHAAAYNGHEGAVEPLLDYGANPNLVDKEGTTAFIAVIRAVRRLRDVSYLIPSVHMGPLWE